jgi:hypothetical protein
VKVGRMFTSSSCVDRNGKQVFAICSAFGKQ